MNEDMKHPDAVDLAAVPVTGEMLEKALSLSGGSEIPLRRCGICNAWLVYRPQGPGVLWYDADCECASLGGGHYTTFQEVADIINNQPNASARNALRVQMYLAPEPAVG